LLPRRRQA